MVYAEALVDSMILPMESMLVQIMAGMLTPGLRKGQRD